MHVIPPLSPLASCNKLKTSWYSCPLPPEFYNSITDVLPDIIHTVYCKCFTKMTLSGVNNLIATQTVTFYISSVLTDEVIFTFNKVIL